MLTLPEVDVRMGVWVTPPLKDFVCCPPPGGSGADSDGDGVPVPSDQCASSGEHLRKQ